MNSSAVPVWKSSFLTLAVIAIAALFAAQSHMSAGAQGPPDHAQEHIPDHVQELLERTGRGERVRVIVELPSQADQGPVASQAQGQGAAVLREYNNFPMLALNVNENALRGLVRSPRVISINEDMANPPALDSSLPVIDADQVHTLGWDGDGITVAILDTGIDRNHPFVADRVVEEACFSSDGFLGFGDQEPLCPNDDTSQTGSGAASINVSNCQDGGTNMCDHGMHVAGIAGGDGNGLTDPLAPDAGVAPAVNIIAIQVFTRREDDDNCDSNAPCVRTFTSDQIAGLDHVYDLRDDYTIAAANMSLGGGENADTCDGDDRKTPIDTLRDANIATVVAAGNDGLGEEVGAPACVSSAIAVGSTTDSDAVSGFSNRGPLLDLFAPGSGITSSVENDGFGGKSGTSMAAPHVAGAWAVMRQAYPNISVGDLLDVFQGTGVDITYASGPGDDPADWNDTVTTPRIDLLAALQDLSDPPDLVVDEGEITVDEGDLAGNSGTVDDHDEGPVTFAASVGTATNNDDGTWSWDFQTTDGPAESQIVTITATNNKGVESETDFDLVVENVAPTVTIEPDQLVQIQEGETLSVAADYSDPGVDDAPFAATTTCYDVDDFTEEVLAGFSSGQVSGTCDYGDTSQSGDSPSGTFTVTVTVTDKDGDSGADTFELTVINVVPTATIDTSSATDIGGTPTFIAKVDESLDFSGDVTDPGSDDLAVIWDWGDDSEVTTSYLANPPDDDPFPSPDIGPRNITDEQSHAWSGACLFEVTFLAEDDDDGEGTDQVDVVIGGDSGQARGSGYWLHQYRGNGRIAFDEDTLDCYLEIVEHMSGVFDEERAATGSHGEAASVLFVAGNDGSLEELLEEQLLAAWLNFANGAFAFDELVDTNGDGVADTPFSDAVAAAEAVRLDGAATDAELEEQKDILESINLMHGG